MNQLAFHLIMSELRSRRKEGRLTNEQYEQLRYGWEVVGSDIVSLEKAAQITGRSERTLYHHIQFEHPLLPAKVVGRGSAIWRPALYILYPELTNKENSNGSQD